MQKKYDCILWLYSNHDMDIGSLIHQIHSFYDSLNLDTPIIGITARVHSSMEEEMKSLGFSYYLSMPISMQDLYRAISELLPRSAADMFLGKKVPVPAEDPELSPAQAGWPAGDLQEDHYGGASTTAKYDLIVTAESTCDIPLDQARREGILLIPYFIADGEGHRFNELYEADADFMLGSAAYNRNEMRVEPPTVDEYSDFFAGALQTAREVIHISMMDYKDSGLSNAKKAAGPFENVHVVDSGSISMGYGKIVQNAAKAASAGFNRQEVMKVIEAVQSRLSLSFVLMRTDDNRFNGLALPLIIRLCNILRLYPVISIKNGRFCVRELLTGDGKDVYRDFVYSVMKKGDADQDLLIMGSIGLDQDQLALIKKETGRYMRFDDITTFKLRSAVSCSCGKGSLGLAYLKKEV